jgi:tetratricopeptide (TPR) repeat protein
VLAEALKNAPADSEWQAVARAALAEKPQPAVSPPPTEPEDGNSLLAEASYIAGVQQYWAGAYARAEEQFLNAIRHDNRDARYYYYLGLSRWSRGKRATAERDFQRAADLERQGRPARSAVNAALERIQGNARQEVDQFRR